MRVQTQLNSSGRARQLGSESGVNAGGSGLHQDPTYRKILLKSLTKSDQVMSLNSPFGEEDRQ